MSEQPPAEAERVGVEVIDLSDVGATHAHHEGVAGESGRHPLEAGTGARGVG